MRFLDGYTIIEMGTAIQGSTAGSALADLGANVIKVEEPDGDFQRYFRTLSGVPLELPGGRNVSFECVNRNKRSITLNLRSEAGRKVLYRLVGSVDAFITNHRMSRREQLGFDYETLRRHNPKLVYGLSSANGEKGPSPDDRGFDNLAVARSGMMYLMGEDEDGPVYMVPGAVDHLGGTMLAFGVTAALLRRERTGEGQLVETSLLGSLLDLLALPLSIYLLGGRIPQRPQRQRLFNPLVGWYKCAGGRWIMLSLNRPQSEWPVLCETLKLGKDVETGAKFGTTKARAENCEELIALLDTVFATEDQATWLAALHAKGMTCGPVNRVDDLADDPQVIANSYLVDVDLPSVGKVKMVGSPFSSGSETMDYRSFAPAVGEHTEEVLVELGYTWDEVVALREQGAL